VTKDREQFREEQRKHFQQEKQKELEIKQDLERKLQAAQDQILVREMNAFEVIL
jgi:hypothetical protein